MVTQNTLLSNRCTNI